MTSRFYIDILTVAICLTFSLSSFGQSPNKKVGQIVESKSLNNIQFDTSKIAIIRFDQKGKYAFPNSYKQTKLTQQDIHDIDSLLIACVNDYNSSLDKEHKRWSIDLNKYEYRRQYVAVTNKDGEKEVWVNCFCSTWLSDKWKTEVMHVDDGGNCYFNFKINLTTRKFYDLGVNGEA